MLEGLLSEPLMTDGFEGSNAVEQLPDCFEGQKLEIVCYRPIFRKGFSRTSEKKLIARPINATNIVLEWGDSNKESSTWPPLILCSLRA